MAGSWSLIVVIATASVLMPAGAAAGQGQTSLKLVDRPAQTGLVYLTFAGSTGGTADYELMRGGIAATFIFRPLAAADFINAFYRWNTSLVLQAEYRNVDVDRRLLSGDLIVRGYDGNMRDPDGGAATFWGLGLGASEATFPSGSGTSSRIWFSPLVEVGYEWNHGPNFVIYLKGQLRYYDHDGLDYTGWSFHCGFGFPIFW